MFTATSNEGGSIAHFDECVVLTTAIQWVSLGAEKVFIAWENGDIYWDIERDTKVDEADRYYPVIVHRRR